MEALSVSMATRTEVSMNARQYFEFIVGSVALALLLTFCIGVLINGQ